MESTTGGDKRMHPKIPGEGQHCMGGRLAVAAALPNWLQLSPLTWVHVSVHTKINDFSSMILHACHTDHSISALVI